MSVEREKAERWMQVAGELINDFADMADQILPKFNKLVELSDEIVEWMRGLQESSRWQENPVVPDDYSKVLVLRQKLITFRDALDQLAIRS